MMARKMKDIDTEEELVETFSQQMRISKGEVRTVFESVDLTLPTFLSVSWQTVKTPRWCWPPRQEECLSHTPSTCHTYTALAFSLYTGRDIDSADSHAH